jgi:hypothetical protein
LHAYELVAEHTATVLRAGLEGQAPFQRGDELPEVAAELAFRGVVARGDQRTLTTASSAEPISSIKKGAKP